MIVSKNKIKKIEQIISKWFNAVIFKTTGSDNLSKEEIKELFDNNIIPSNYDKSPYIEEMYKIGLLRNNMGGIFSKDNLNIYRIKQSKQYKPLTDKEVFAINYVKQSMNSQLLKLKQSVNAAIVSNVLRQTNNAIQTSINKDIKNIVISAIEKKKTIKKIAKDLRDYTKDINRDWNRVAVSEMSDAFNNGAADAISLRNNGISDKSIYVFKMVSPDEALCEFCSKLFLLPNNEPKVYTLDELRNNGDNYGRKPSQYKAVIGKTHIGCRCSLCEIAKGWGFKPKTSIVTFINKDYDILQDQKIKIKKWRSNGKKKKRGSGGKSK